MYSKTLQLSKTKKVNLKKITKLERRLYSDFIREKCKGICQIPWCNNNAQDMAHKDRAYKRDDRYQAMICRACHTIADSPSPKQIDLSSKTNLALSAVCKRNWKDYTS